MATSGDLVVLYLMATSGDLVVLYLMATSGDLVVLYLMATSGDLVVLYLMATSGDLVVLYLMATSGDLVVLYLLATSGDLVVLKRSRLGQVVMQESCGRVTAPPQPAGRSVVPPPGRSAHRGRFGLPQTPTLLTRHCNSGVKTSDGARTATCKEEGGKVGRQKGQDAEHRGRRP
ncbi:hypothetical protein GWK47_015723 [Chionoecetes opilio]|uniref:Uncharacterized protein n=1 Tax=Chionoecetes opilio TaxID=41210 RepID=A0A8J5CKI7_CHIOP|nr:hypothetical protein GWK47_015723 [Chionoecetes opilio]